MWALWLCVCDTLALRCAGVFYTRTFDYSQTGGIAAQASIVCNISVLSTVSMESEDRQAAKAEVTAKA